MTPLVSLANKVMKLRQQQQQQQQQQPPSTKQQVVAKAMHLGFALALMPWPSSA